LQAFEVLRSVETHRLGGDAVKDVLHPNRSVLLVDEDARCIFILRGEHTSLVIKLITLRIAKELQRVLNGTYAIKNLSDQESINTISGVSLVPKGNIPELYNPSLYSNEDLAKIAQDPEKSPIQNDPTWKERLTFEKLKVFDTTHMGQSLSNLHEIAPPTGFQCEMVLIDSSVYTPAHRMEHFLRLREISNHFHKLGKLPEGLFFEPEYTPRISIKGGKVQSIELFKKQSEPFNSDEKNILGTIHAPLLHIPRIMTDRPLQALQNGFKIPQEPTVEEIIENINASKT